MENTNLWVLFSAIVVVYYIVIWFLFGKDNISSEKSLRELPEEIDPITAHYLINKMANSKTAAIGIVSLALNGYIDVNDDDGEFLIYKRKNFKEKERLAESFIFNTLFSDRDFAVLGTYDSHKCFSLTYGLHGIFMDSLFHSKFINRNKWLHFSTVFLGLVFVVISAFYSDIVSITIMFCLSLIIFFFFSNPLKSYSKEGERVVSTLDEMSNGIKNKNDILWSMVFDNESYLDKQYTSDSFDWFGVVDGEVTGLTIDQRKENRRSQKESFIKWLSENIVFSLMSVVNNSKTLFEKGRRTGFINAAEEKRKAKKFSQI